MKNNTLSLIKSYYEAFNAWDIERFVSLLAEDVIHDINQGSQQIGKQAFSKFMQHMGECYSEQAEDIVIMVSEDGNRAAAEFIIVGTYLKTDGSLPPAHQQTYEIPVGTFFEIRNNKIYRVTNHYNLQEWLRQIKE